MGRAFTVSVAIIATGAIIVALLLYGVRGLQTSCAQMRSTVSDYSTLTEQAAAATEKERQMQKEGVASFSYQLALSLRQTLTARIEKAVAEAGITLVGKDVTDPKVEIRFTDTHLKALKLLGKLEAEFTELRARSIVWAGQPDGLVSITATYDVWPIPVPAARKNP